MFLKFFINYGKVSGLIGLKKVKRFFLCLERKERVAAAMRTREEKKGAKAFKSPSI